MKTGGSIIVQAESGALLLAGRPFSPAGRALQIHPESIKPRAGRYHSDIKKA
jgi:hypothetical protein